MTVEQKLMTAEELARLPRGRARHELIGGVLLTMPLHGYEHGCLVTEFAISIRLHV